MKLKAFLYYSLFLLLVSCHSDDLPGKIKEIGIEKKQVTLQGKDKQSTIIKTKEPGWAIGGVYIPDEQNGGLKLVRNTTHWKEYEDGSKIHQLCDTMVYEWIELIKVKPNELKIIVEENPLPVNRSITIHLEGLVGYFGEDLFIIQEGTVTP